MLYPMDVFVVDNETIYFSLLKIAKTATKLYTLYEDEGEKERRIDL